MSTHTPPAHTVKSRLATLAPCITLLCVLFSTQAAAQWDCKSLADGSWSCNADTPDAGQVQAAPDTVKETPPADDTLTPADVDEETVKESTVTEDTTEPAPQTTPETVEEPESPLREEPATDTGTAAAQKIAPPRAVHFNDEVPEVDPWALCPPVPQYDTRELSGEPGSIDLQADSAQVSGDGNTYTLTGNAVVDDGQQRLAADTVIYRQDENIVEATGNLRLSAPGIIVEGESGVLHPDTEKGSLQKIRYVITEQHGRGSAESLEINGRDLQHLDNVTYTTCPPGNNDWQLSANKIDLDHSQGVGTAQDAKLRFKDVPIFYSPFLSFPLDERRKSGFLFPRVGHSDATGADISVPYYWNIAPHRDATIVPRYMSDRGLMIGGEFRYLNKTNSGMLRADYLPSDNEFDDEDRSLVSIEHSGNPVPRLETHIKAANASDDHVFNDFGSTLVQTSKTNLERTGTAEYHGNWWDVGLMVRDFQTLDPGDLLTEKPYKQLPKIYFEAMPDKRPWGFKLSAAGEFDYFKISGNDQVEGKRLDLYPRISYPVNRAAWYMEPAVGVRYTRYDLDDVAAGENDSPDRTTPVASFDAGTFFERTSSWGETAYVQTLEPRLFYLYVPEKDQDDLPVFDTGDYDFNFWNLFRDNRFSGPDRMGDANQLALALTTRFLDPASGQQWLSASIGELIYFSDREVTLPGEPVETDDSSDLIGEVTLALGHHWNANATVLWDPHDSRTERNDYRLRYQPGPRKLVNLSYRQRHELQEQVDLSFLWPLSPSWHAVGRWYYSLQSSEIIEAIAGIGYESCCWGAQLVGRSYVKSGEEDRVDEIFLQLELKGLGKLGTVVDDVLERGILGY